MESGLDLFIDWNKNFIGKKNAQNDKSKLKLTPLIIETNDIDGEVERMEGCGIQFLGKVRPGSAGTKVTFIHPKSLEGVLAELCSHPK